MLRRSKEARREEFRKGINRVSIGSTQSGKNTGENVDSVADKRRGSASVHVYPHADAGLELIDIFTFLGLTDNLIVDDLAATDRVIVEDLLTPSKDPNPIQRMMDNEDRVDDLLEEFSQHREFENMEGHPMFEDWGRPLLLVWINMPKRFPLSRVHRLLNPRDELHEYAVNTTEDEDSAYKLAGLKYVSDYERRRDIAPLERLLRQNFAMTAVRIREGEPSWDFEEGLKNGVFYIMLGGRNQRTNRMMMRKRIEQTIQFVRSHHVNVKAVIDESQTVGGGGLMTPNITAAFAEHAKKGLSIDVLNQDANFGDTEKTTRIFQNCEIHFWYRCRDYETALFGAHDICHPDFFRVHHRELTYQQFHAGYAYEDMESYSDSVGEGTTDTETHGNTHGEDRSSDTNSNARGRTKNKSKTVSRKKEARAQYEVVPQERDLYWQTDDQFLDAANQLRGLGQGERFVCEGSRVYREKVKRLEAWYGLSDLAEAKREKFLDELKHTSPYRTAVLPKFERPVIVSKEGSKNGGTKKSNGESRYTRARQKNSSTSSRRGQRLTAGSRN